MYFSDIDQVIYGYSSSDVAEVGVVSENSEYF